MTSIEVHSIANLKMRKTSDRQYRIFEASRLRSNHSIANLSFPAAQATQAAEAAQAAQALQAAQAAQGPRLTKRRRSGGSFQHHSIAILEKWKK